MPKRLNQGKKIKFSVIIPTSGNPVGVTRLLTSLSRIDYEDFEVLVIDNGPQKTCFAQFSKFRSQQNFFYFFIRKKGASIARNFGIKKAKFPFLVFLDDDVIVQPAFLQGYEDAWKKYDDHILLGGTTNAIKFSGDCLTREEERLLLQHGWYFVHRLTEKDKNIELGNLLFPANFSMAKENDLFFNEKLGVLINGKVLLGAEDFELTTRVLLSGGKVCLLADRRLRVNHYVSDARFSQKYLMHRATWAGVELVFMEGFLKRLFPDSDLSYLRRALQAKNIRKTLFDPIERQLFLSYLINKNINVG